MSRWEGVRLDFVVGKECEAWDHASPALDGDPVGFAHADDEVLSQPVVDALPQRTVGGSEGAEGAWRGKLEDAVEDVREHLGVEHGAGVVLSRLRNASRRRKRAWACRPGSAVHRREHCGFGESCDA
jgi:hypothetical protein